MHDEQGGWPRLLRPLGKDPHQVAYRSAALYDSAGLSDLHRRLFQLPDCGQRNPPITDEHNVSRAKLAYLIDATAAPVCIIAPISSWAAAVSGFVEAQDGFALFIRAIPYNYYALLTIAMMIVITIAKIDYGPMRKHEDNAILYNDLYTTPDRPYADAEKEIVENDKAKVMDMVLPVVVLIIFCIIGIMYSGGFFSGTGFIESFSSSDASVGLSVASVFALIFAVIYYMGRRVLSFRECMDSVPEGFKAMVPAILILTFAWSLKAMTDSLGCSLCRRCNSKQRRT